MEQLPRLWDHWYALCRARELPYRGALARTVLGRRVRLGRRDDGQPWAVDGARPLPARTQQGLVWVFPRPCPTPPHDPLRLPLLGEPGVATWTQRFVAHAGLLDAIENTLDAPHTHFVHGGLVRSEGARQVVRATVRPSRDGVEVEYRDEPRQSGWFARLLATDVEVSYGRFLLPSVAQLDYRGAPSGRLVFSMLLTPETPTRTRMLAVASGQGRVGPLPARVVMPLLKPLFRRAARQDMAILAEQTRNVARFGGPRYAHTELDLIRGQVARLLVGERPEPAAPRQVELLL